MYSTWWLTQRWLHTATSTRRDFPSISMKRTGLFKCERREGWPTSCWTEAARSRPTQSLVSIGSTVNTSTKSNQPTETPTIANTYHDVCWKCNRLRDSRKTYWSETDTHLDLAYIDLKITLCGANTWTKQNTIHNSRKAKVDGAVYALATADNALFASTGEGNIYCFRSGGKDNQLYNKIIT